MSSIDPRPKTGFRAGDDVVLAEGTYQGTDGVFLGFREDANWANIRDATAASAATRWPGWRKRPPPIREALAL